MAREDFPQGTARISKSTHTPEYRIFLEQLQRRRKEKDLSQRELGRRLGQHHNFVSSVEMGDRVLNFVEVRDWCLALDLSWIEFTQEVDALLSQTFAEKPAEN